MGSLLGSLPRAFKKLLVCLFGDKQFFFLLIFSFPFSPFFYIYFKQLIQSIKTYIHDDLFTKTYFFLSSPFRRVFLLCVNEIPRRGEEGEGTDDL